MMKNDMGNLPDLFTIFWMSHCYNFGEESKKSTAGAEKNTKNENNIVYINIFLILYYKYYFR